MTFTARLVLIVTLLLAVADGISAQPQKKAAPATATSTAATTTATSTDEESATPPGEVIREQFATLLHRRPYEVAQLLVLDPTLMSNESFMSAYPDVAHFVAEHPEIKRNPRYYLADFRQREPQKSGLADVSEALGIGLIFTAIAFSLAWLIRTIVEQKRWSRLAKTQSEVHNKILDRFATSEEVLNYIKTPAGTKFLESAPIPLYAEQPTRNVPMSRAVRSIHAGIVVGAGALGILTASVRFDSESAHALWAIGVIALSVGAGFIASGVLSIVLSRRLNLVSSSEQ